MTTLGEIVRRYGAQYRAHLPVPYLLITFTLPSELRPLAYRHQRQLCLTTMTASSPPAK